MAAPHYVHEGTRIQEGRPAMPTGTTDCENRNASSRDNPYNFVSVDAQQGSGVRPAASYDNLHPAPETTPPSLACGKSTKQHQ